MKDIKKDIKKSAGEGPSGWSGVSAYSGRIDKPTRRSYCSSYEWPTLAEEMYIYDTDISTAWRSLKNTLLSARFEWIPGPAAEGEDPELAEVAEELARSMNENMGLGGYSGRMNRSFENILSQILLYLPVGFRYAEVCWKYNKNEERYDIADIKDRKPSAHDQWITWPVDLEGNRLPDQPHTGKFTGVLQKPAVGDLVSPDIRGKRPFIPAESLLLFVLDQEGDDYNGIGLLRPLEPVYHRKNKAYLKLNHFLDSRSVPIIEVDDQAAHEEEGCDLVSVREQLERARVGAHDLMQGRTAFIETYSKVKINNQLMLEHAPEKAQAILDAAKMEILSVFFVQFLMLGVTDTGSRSVGEVHESFFRRASINVLDYICSVFNGDWKPGKGLAGAYAYMNLDMDYIPTDILPKLIHKGLEIDPTLEHLGNVIVCYEKGLLGELTSDDKQHLRTIFGLPQLPREENKDAIGVEGSPGASEGEEG